MHVPVLCFPNSSSEATSNADRSQVQSRRRRLLALLPMLAAIAVAGCGESEEAKARERFVASLSDVEADLSQSVESATGRPPKESVVYDSCTGSTSDPPGITVSGVPGDAATVGREETDLVATLLDEGWVEIDDGDLFVKRYSGYRFELLLGTPEEGGQQRLSLWASAGLGPCGPS